MTEHPTAERTVFTIGYGNLGCESLLLRLRQAGVERVVDVRSQPYSRHHPEFGRESLARLCLAEGIAYAYEGDRLGGMPDWPEVLREGKPDRELIRLDPRFRRGLSDLLPTLETPSALLCGCARPEQCHRGPLLSTELQRLGCRVVHIGLNGTLRDHEATPQETQGALFS